MDNLKFRAFPTDWWDGVNILVKFWDKGDCKFRRGALIAGDFTIEGEYVEPTVRLDKGQAQLLMDDLWNCGVRPSEGSGSAGSLAATQKHLEDMRTLVFDDIKRRK